MEQQPKNTTKAEEITPKQEQLSQAPPIKPSEQTGFKRIVLSQLINLTSTVLMFPIVSIIPILLLFKFRNHSNHVTSKKVRHIISTSYLSICVLWAALMTLSASVVAFGAGFSDPETHNLLISFRNSLYSAHIVSGLGLLTISLYVWVLIRSLSILFKKTF